VINDRLRTVCVCALAVSAAFAVCTAPVVSAAAGAAPVRVRTAQARTARLRTGDPSANRKLSGTTLLTCRSAPDSAACIAGALRQINSARRSEGIKAMVLPSGFASLPKPVQLLVLVNLERIDRGLPPFLGLARSLDRDSARAAAAGEDPSPGVLHGVGYASNVEGGYGSTLEADFAWMYDDGYGSFNLDCASPHASGCWGHRHDILVKFPSPLVMGAAAGTGRYGPSMTELFIGGDSDTGRGQPDAPIAPTWATIVQRFSLTP
jgi:hypothetical protein